MTQTIRSLSPQQQVYIYLVIYLISGVLLFLPYIFCVAKGRHGDGEMKCVRLCYKGINPTGACEEQGRKGGGKTMCV